jgi:hypothetical protein
VHSANNNHSTTANVVGQRRNQIKQNLDWTPILFDNLLEVMFTHISSSCTYHHLSQNLWRLYYKWYTHTHAHTPHLNHTSEVKIRLGPVVVLFLLFLLFWYRTCSKTSCREEFGNFYEQVIHIY